MLNGDKSYSKKTNEDFLFLDVFHQEKGPDDEYTRNNFVVSDTDDDQLNIVGHPVIVNSIIVALCVRGEADVRLNFKTYHLTKGSCVVLATESMFLCEEGNYSEDFLADYISFSLNYTKELDLRSFFYDIKKNPHIQLKDSEYKRVYDIYKNLKFRYEDNGNTYQKEVIQYSLMVAICDFSDIYDKYVVDPQEPEGDPYVRKFFDLLYKYYQTKRKTDFYAEKICITPKYLSRIVKGKTGYTVQEWIFRLILFESKSLLKTTNMNVVELASHFHFPDSTSYGKFFKKHEGMTPLEYRAK